MSSLGGLHVLVTRPSGQAGHLCHLIESEGGQVVLLPTIEIEPIHYEKTPWKLERQNIVIFISPNAVNHFKQPLPLSVQVASVGESTSAALKAMGVVVHYQPQQFNTEGLLALPEFTQVQGKHILIVKGEGGRDLLAHALQQRGAFVTEAVVYRRIMPNIDLAKTLPNWKRPQIDVIVCTSNTGLENLLNMFDVEDRTWIFNTQLIVLSKRTANFAQELGFVRMPVVSENASDEKIVSALQSFRRSY